jgi:hypothetical protein
MFRKLDPFVSPGEEKKASTLLGPLERVKLSHWPSEFWTIDKVQKFSGTQNLKVYDYLFLRSLIYEYS